MVVYGERSLDYDFGPLHPLTPRRFGPGIDLLREIGAEDFLAPEPATRGQLERLHLAAYIDAMERFSADPGLPPAWGIGPGDCPAFRGMHEASAAVAGGSLAAMQLILDGELGHAFHPGGGLHHAMAGRASGFCIYNDPALAIALARDAGHRVLYVDIDVHHGDGVEALFWDDPEVVTLSIHESGLTLFPGSGYVEERGAPEARGTAVNVPLMAGTGDGSWLAAVESIVPALADAFAPTILVTQHGCDSHALDPLAHLRLTTVAYRRAAVLLDTIAHRYTEGRWLATGGGGYDAYRVVPRAWALVWLAQAHREPPEGTPLRWRERWADEAARHDQGPPADDFLDQPGTVEPEPGSIATANRRHAEAALSGALRHLHGGME